MIESLTAWTSAAMIVAWLSIGTIVGVKPKDIAEAISKASIEKPLFEGEDGARRTAAFLTAVGVYESGFKQIAGDCKGLKPGDANCGKEGTAPTSYCFLQIHFEPGVERVKGYTKEELMKDPLACARAGREIMRDSMNVKGNEDEPLRMYASTTPQARRRFDLAKKLFKTVPFSIRCD